MRRGALAAISVALMVGLIGPTQAQEVDFSPTWTFGLSTRKGKANPAVTIDVAQELGEEELAHVTLGIPAGFTLPQDDAITDGEELGTGEIIINTGADCVAGTDGVPNEPPIPVSIVEVDRSEEQMSSGAVAVWRVDLQPVTTIDLVVTGSKTAGWSLDGDIPQNAATCPPFQFTATINPTSSETGTKLIVNPNPKRKKAYTFTAESQSTVGTLDSASQVIKIKGRPRKKH